MDITRSYCPGREAAELNTTDPYVGNDRRNRSLIGLYILYSIQRYLEISSASCTYIAPQRLATSVSEWNSPKALLMPWFILVKVAGDCH